MSARTPHATEPAPLLEWDVTCRFDDEAMQEHRLTRPFAAPLQETACLYMVNYLMAGLCIVKEFQIKEIKATLRKGRA